MDFSNALFALKEGHTVGRTGWNGKGMFLRILKGVPVRVMDPPPPTFVLNGELNDAFAHVRTIEYAPHIAMWTAQGQYVPWLASVTDIMAEDWEIVQ